MDPNGGTVESSFPCGRSDSLGAENETNQRLSLAHSTIRISPSSVHRVASYRFQCRVTISAFERKAVPESPQRVTRVQSLLFQREMT
jgi:hypothetical protein